VTPSVAARGDTNTSDATADYDNNDGGDDDDDNYDD